MIRHAFRTISRTDRQRDLPGAGDRPQLEFRLEGGTSDVGGGLFDAAGYNVWNAGMSWRVTRRLELFGRIENLFNREYEEVFGHRQEAYQRLLEDAMEGDHRRFGRADAIEEQWRVCDALLQDPPDLMLVIDPARVHRRA